MDVHCARPIAIADRFPCLGIRGKTHRMTLQRKIIFAFLVLGAGFAIAAYTGLQAAIFPAFESFERESAVQSLERAKHALDAALTFEQQPSHWQAEVAER